MTACKKRNDRLILKPDWCGIVVVKDHHNTSYPYCNLSEIISPNICGISNSPKKRIITSPPDIRGSRPWVSDKGSSWWRWIRPRWQQAAAIQLQFWCHTSFSPWSWFYFCHQCFQNSRMISRCHLPDYPGECLVSLFPSGKSPHLNPTTFLAKKKFSWFLLWK